MLLTGGTAHAADWSGNISVQSRNFLHDPATINTGQQNNPWLPNPSFIIAGTTTTKALPSRLFTDLTSMMRNAHMATSASLPG